MWVSWSRTCAYMASTRASRHSPARLAFRRRRRTSASMVTAIRTRNGVAPLLSSAVCFSLAQWRYPVTSRRRCSCSNSRHVSFASRSHSFSSTTEVCRAARSTTSWASMLHGHSAPTWRLVSVMHLWQSQWQRSQSPLVSPDLKHLPLPIGSASARILYTESVTLRGIASCWRPLKMRYIMRRSGEAEGSSSSVAFEAAG
mmetsp:Transcript_77539/g.153976  ORF Transcript_77539/g.153976 Transcript_77539/m.153976 type:complete len:200 (-) Transcript_77539:79-678(-)